VGAAIAVKVIPALHGPPRQAVERVVTVALVCILFGRQAAYRVVAVPARGQADRDGRGSGHNADGGRRPVSRRCAVARVEGAAIGYPTRMSREITYEIIVRHQASGHGKHRWVFVCEHLDCGKKGSPAEHLTTCRDADCAEKAAWDHARRAHRDDTAVIAVRRDA